MNVCQILNQNESTHTQNYEERSDIDWKGFHCLRTGVADKNK